ncbi:hypothetical protein MNEG_12343 [Monoraphidium neglectum]|uniref:Uncharacterized protein n=1 Tax=Monoraphidium neglectum TaxID=145388 RepID=A0A0D2KIL9_9CHLO|nr:hypothetical protein MNEG_12343 [Monoraphidium neglectum]KIY95618.1 hypothetical protein MNEG_12343 [Monoraphidium neglectum]|eukprot:XP_013894638.1 hypothetical protein MNEG_12343 [Monoraphidium neglectum]
MLGSVAAGGALLTHMDLARMLDWGGLPGSLPALAPLFGPLLLLETTLLAVPWRLPAALLEQGASNNPKDTTTDFSASASMSGSNSSIGSTSSSSSGNGSGGGSAAERRGVGDSSGAVRHAQPPVDLDLLEAAGWSPAALQLGLAEYRRSALVAPGAWGRPPLRVEAPLVAARAASEEALRAFTITFLGGWGAGRLLEAGLEDVVRLPALMLFLVTGDGGDVEVPLQLLARCLAAGVLTAVLLPVAAIGAADAQEAAAAALLLDTEAGRAAARAVAADAAPPKRRSREWRAEDAFRVEEEGGRAAQAVSKTEAALDALLGQLGGAGSGGGGSGGNSSSSSSRSSEVSKQLPATTAGEASARPSQQEQAGCKPEKEEEQEEEGDEEVDPLVLEWRVQFAGERCANSVPARIAGWLAFTRGAGRLFAANVGFVASGGNLAATLTAVLALSALRLGCAVANGRRDGDGGAVAGRAGRRSGE